jgi:glycosyltransferase involved in cell wall biosynthesis
MSPHDHCCVLITIPVLLVGGTEMQTLNLVRTLVDNGYRVTVCCYYDHGDSMVAAMEAAGARVVLLDMVSSTGLWCLFRKLTRFFAEQHPDIVHVQYIAPALIPILAARLARIPTIFATVHQPGSTYGLKAKLLLRTAAQLCSAFFCNSLAVERSWFGSAALFDPQHTHRHRHCTIYNSVDVERIATSAANSDRTMLRATLNIGDPPVVGIVGRLRWEKGQGVLLEAMVTVVRQIPSVLLLMVGDGPDREGLQRQSERLGIVDNVRWLGQQTTEELFRLYSIMDVVAVPSIFEGFGLVAAEAMAAGLPVVATAVDGLTEIIIDQETGRLVPPQDADALAAALIQLLTSPEAATGMGQKGQQRVGAHFSLQRFSENTLAAYAAFQCSR